MSSPKPAPPKPAKPKKPAPKPREDWYFRRSTFPLRDAAPTELERFWENQHNFPRALNAEWIESGPANYAGRVTSLAVDPTDNRRVLAGSAGGGLWATYDRGGSWQSIWPKYVNQSIGAVAFSPSDPGMIVCATGEGNLSGASYPGSGIYLSRDAGFTWQSFITSPGGGDINPAARRTLPRRITCIAWGPKSDDSGMDIAFGSSTKESVLHAGLFINKGDQGMSFVKRWGTRSYNCYSVVFHPTRPGIIYAAVEPGGTLNGIWRSGDYGETWRQFTTANGLPPGETCGRISLAISPSDPDVLYALVAATRDIGGVHGVFRTADGGEHWKRTISPELAAERQLQYNNTIAVHPTDPDCAICGAVDLHGTWDGGARWIPISTGKRDTPDGKIPANFVHSDHHAIVILNDGWIYSGNDGGFAVSNSAGRKWTDRSFGMVTTMFYDLDVAPSNANIFGGGAQDAGSLISGVTPDGSPAADPRIHTRVLPGDGGWMVFDPADAHHVVGSSGGSDIDRHSPGLKYANGDRLSIGDPPAEGWNHLKDNLDLARAESKLRAFTILAFQPPVRGRSSQLWLATNRLRRSSDVGDTWQFASGMFDDSAISALEFSSKNPAIIFVGTSDGGIYRSRNNGRTWSADISGPEIPRRLISQIEVHPCDESIVVATVASTGAPAALLNTQNRTYGHVFRSRDGGDTWEDIDQGQLPNVVYNGLAFETHAPHRIFVGGDAGIWMYQDDAWISINGSLPNVVVSDLIYHPDGILTAATYGRGIWRLPTPKGFAFEIAQPITVDASEPRIPAAGLVRDYSVPAPQLIAPNAGAEISIFPRQTNLSWEPVPNAVGYVVRFTTGHGIVDFQTSPVPGLTYMGRGSGSMSWLVWAILPHSRCSGPSESRTVRYLR